MDPYREKGIEWIYKLVEKDSECKATLYDHTLFYLEEYIGSFVARHRMEFRMDVKLAQKMQIILEYMVSQESQIAFLLGSKFDILFAVVTHPILTTVLLLLLAALICRILLRFAHSVIVISAVTTYPGKLRKNRANLSKLGGL